MTDPEDRWLNAEMARYDEADHNRRHETNARRVVEPSRGCWMPGCDRSCE